MNQQNEGNAYTIFQPKNSNRYSVKFSIRGQGQQRIALGTTDKDEAERLANALHKAGLSVTRKKFEDIAAEFIEELELEVKQGEKDEYQLKQYKPIIERYFVGNDLSPESSSKV